MAPKPFFTGFDRRRYRHGDRVLIHPDSARAVRLAPGTVGTVVGSSLTPADRVHVELADGRRIAGYEVSFRKMTAGEGAERIHAARRVKANPAHQAYTVGGGRRRYATLEEAKAAANHVFQRTGAIVSIEAAPAAKPARAAKRSSGPAAAETDDTGGVLLRTKPGALVTQEPPIWSDGSPVVGWPHGTARVQSVAKTAGVWWVEVVTPGGGWGRWQAAEIYPADKPAAALALARKRQKRK